MIYDTNGRPNYTDVPQKQCCNVKVFGKIGHSLGPIIATNPTITNPMIMAQKRNDELSN